MALAYCEIEKSYHAEKGKGYAVSPDHAKPRWFPDLTAVFTALLQYPEGWDLPTIDKPHFFKEE
jgi:hypothetical protein